MLRVLFSYTLRIPYLSDDYSSLPLDCRLEPGDTSQCVEITITDDDLVELTESFSVSFSTVEIVQDTAVVYIEDNDSEFVVKYIGLRTKSCPCDFFPNDLCLVIC